MPKIRICKTAGCSNELSTRNHYCSRKCQLLSKADRSAGPDGCWIWTGHVNPQNGYGQVTNGETAHRLSYRLHYADPGDLCVLHKCDRRTCLNPRHLFLGTKADNWRDSVAKGRQTVIAPGDGNTRAKLTTADTLAIRQSTAKSRDLAAEYGVTRETIANIRSRKSWAHIPDRKFDGDPASWVFMQGVMYRPAPPITS